MPFLIFHQGANGSQDPARGYVSGGDQATFGTSCTINLMVRADHQQAATWSNQLDVTAAC